MTEQEWHQLYTARLAVSDARLAVLNVDSVQHRDTLQEMQTMLGEIRDRLFEIMAEGVANLEPEE